MTYYNPYKFINNLNFGYSKPKSLACFLINLFYKSGCKYSCSRTKICRLLTIYALCRIGENDQLLDNYFYANANTINLISYHINDIVDRDVYMLLSYEADDCKIFLDKFDDSAAIPQFCQEHLSNISISNKEKELLETIFRMFASYPIHELATSIDSIAINMPFETWKIDESSSKLKISVGDFIKFLNNNITLYENNQVFIFIKNLVDANYKNNKKIIYFN